MEDRIAWLDAELLKQRHNNAVEAQKRLNAIDHVAERREADKLRKRAARHPRPEPAPIPRKNIKIGNHWMCVRTDLPLLDHQVAHDASKHEMAALAVRVAVEPVREGKRTRAAQGVDKYGKLR